MKITKIDILENCPSKEVLFNQIADHFLAAKTIDNHAEFVEALVARENEVSTGFVDGFAIPHGKSSTVKEPGLIFMKIKNGVEWPSMDGALTTDVFSLAIPEDGGKEHLKILTLISRKLVDEDFRKQIKNAQTEEEIAVIIEEIIG